MLNEELLEVVVADGINSCDYDILHLSVFRELIKSVFIDKIHPVLPLILFREINVIIDKPTIESRRKNLFLKFYFHSIELTIANLLELHIEWASVFSVD
jgi:hypothetical protein